MRTSALNLGRISCHVAMLLCATPLIALAQDQGEDLVSLSPEPPPAIDLQAPGAEGVPPLASGATGEQTIVPAVPIDPALSQLPEIELPAPRRAFPFGYNLRQDTISWLVGSGDQFGMFSLETFPVLSFTKASGLVGGMNFHWLGGPIQTDMPPRLFDFQLGWQQRKWTSESFGFDLALRVGAFADFEGSARDGIRFPGHAVGYYRWNPRLDLALGIEYLDRDDITLLPVAGVIFTPRDDLRLELVFPRPRAEVWISPAHSLYLSGELGGGTWAIERATKTDDVVTYRDLRLLLGISTVSAKGHLAALEIGYVFDRHLGYRSGTPEFAPDDTTLVRLTHLY